MAESDCYRMTSRPRGLCYIINNVSEEDPQNGIDFLRTTFESLHFTVSTFHGLNHEEFLGVLEGLSDTDHSEYDCVVLFITAHGEDDVVCSIDNKDVKVEDIAEYLKPLSCPSLADKPKVIFIESCRGDNSQYPIALEDVTDAVTAFPKNHFPNEADFLFGYSTVRSFVSYKNCYKKILSDTLSNRAHSEHLADMLTEVNRKMSEIPHNTRHGTRVYQTSEMTSRLRKKLFLNQ